MGHTNAGTQRWGALPAFKSVNFEQFKTFKPQKAKGFVNDMYNAPPRKQRYYNLRFLIFTFFLYC